MDAGNTSRIENGLIDVKVVALWKIAEALGMPLSKFIHKIELKAGDNFHFFEE